MSLLHHPLSNSTYRLKFHFPTTTTTTYVNSTKTLNFSLTHHPFQFFTQNGQQFQRNFDLLRSRHWHIIKAYDSSIADLHQEQQQQQQQQSPKSLNFDAFLSFVESVCVVSSVAIALGCFVNLVVFRQGSSELIVLGNRVLTWLLAGAVAVGSVIRRRQWRRVCGVKSRLGSENGNVIERIEKLEESMRSATTIIRMLSRQLEKLGIRFRVTRKALKDPISETAALAQKNSEVTRALAVQEDILEKELAEVQKVLLAMQDQQQKQLELIVAIAKSGKLVETKQAPTSQGLEMHETNSRANKGLGQVVEDGQQIQAIAAKKGATNDKASGS